MSSKEPRKRVAVVIPKHRVWLWHQQVITALQETFDVVTYVNTEATPYPLFVRMWLAFENAFLKERVRAKAVTLYGEPWTCGDDHFFSILNFSESEIGSSRVPIIEPRYDNSLDSICLIAAIINRNTPLISIQLVGSKEPLVSSYPAIWDKTTLGGGLQTCFARLAALAQRATNHLLNDSRAAMLPIPSRASSTLSIFSIVLFVCSFSYRAGRRLFKFARYDEHWSIGVLWTDKLDLPNDVPLTKFTKLKDDRRRYYADPFIFSHKGTKWLFAEELGYLEKKGVICCAALRPGETTATFQPVLTRPYHVSYPLVFSHGEFIYMLPETGSNHQLELYRARSFPFDWVLERVLLHDVQVYDPTIFNYQNRWWIFGTIAHKDGSDCDELAIFYSDRLDGCWKPHHLNPVKSDCRSARPAGRIMVVGDRLLRPAQVCENGYGMGIVWLEILELTPASYDERQIEHWPGSAAGAQGIHTFNCDDELAVVDTRRSFTSLKALFARRDAISEEVAPP